MSFDLWLAPVAASAIFLMIPGPPVLVVISFALDHGREPAAAIVAGVALGDLTAMTASMLGLGAILVASTAILTELRWSRGAYLGYLVYLGIKLWRAPTQKIQMTCRRLVRRGCCATLYTVTALPSEEHHVFRRLCPAVFRRDPPLLGPGRDVGGKCSSPLPRSMPPFSPCWPQLPGRDAAALGSAPLTGPAVHS
jgi:hypothetical protein